MGAASLPRSAEGRAGRSDQPGVRVGSDQLHPGKAAGDEVAEEREPAGAVLGGVDLQAEDLPVPLRVHPGRDQHGDLDHAPALADLHGERVGGDERVRARVQGAGAKLLDLPVEVLRHLGHL